ncbi:hypothetical protein OIV83_000159 [Microbotryomycetes sp. JL201]|nr:hypothetical protein OIV83_000159 [Microbotryomycetes sp. JL201]
MSAIETMQQSPTSGERLLVQTTTPTPLDDDKQLAFDSPTALSKTLSVGYDGARPGILDVFLGRDKRRLQSDNIVWDQGAAAWWTSVKQRANAIMTRRFIACVLLGQLLSFSLTTTSVVTTQLGINNWSMPTTQSLFFYFSLNLLYTPYTMYRYGFRAWLSMLWRDGWKYLILAAVDVEANFLVIKAYGYTDLLSCMLLNAWATPACMIFTFFLVRARYHWTQVLGVLICIAGLALNVVSDWHTDKNYPANNRVLGDILMLIGATGYGLSNSLEERFVRERPLYEIVGQLGFWGCMINATQGAALEHDLFMTVSWSGRNIGLLIAYTCAMLLLYTGAPVLFRLGSSVFYNLSILTSNFYGLCFGLGLYHYRPYFLYFIAYPLVLVGLFVYFVVAKPEATSTAELQVTARGKQAAREEAAGHRRVVGQNI